MWVLAAVVSIGAALLLQPLGEWGTFTIILGVLVVLLGIIGVSTLATGKGQIMGPRMSVKSQRIVSIIGLVAATVLILSYLVTDWANWTAQDALTIGIWVAVGAIFAEGLVIARTTS